MGPVIQDRDPLAVHAERRLDAVSVTEVQLQHFAGLDTQQLESLVGVAVLAVTPDNLAHQRDRAVTVKEVHPELSQQALFGDPDLHPPPLVRWAVVHETERCQALVLPHLSVHEASDSGQQRVDVVAHPGVKDEVRSSVVDLRDDGSGQRFASAHPVLDAVDSLHPDRPTAHSTPLSVVINAERRLWAEALRERRGERGSGPSVAREGRQVVECCSHGDLRQ
jgi:hypothetical protein